MSREEAIVALKARCHYCEHFPTCVHDKPECFRAAEMAIRSLEAWDEVIDYIQTRNEETKQDMAEDTDNKEWYLGYWQGLSESMVVIKTLLKEVEE